MARVSLTAGRPEHDWASSPLEPITKCMDDDSRREDHLSDLEGRAGEYDEDADAFGLEEPSDDFDRDVEWVEEPSPEERWEIHLDREFESDRLQQLLDALIALRCNKGELLQALLRVKNEYTYGSAQRSELLKRAELLAKAQEYLPVSVGDRFSNEDWKRLQNLLSRYLEHLRLQTERMKKNPRLARRQALIAVLDLVQKWTGEPQYQLLSELLRLFVDDSLTEENLRQYARRASLPQKRASKPRLPTRRKDKKGRKADLSGYVKAKRVKQARARAGLDQWDDDDDWN